MANISPGHRAVLCAAVTDHGTCDPDVNLLSSSIWTIDEPRPFRSLSFKQRYPCQQRRAVVAAPPDQNDSHTCTKCNAYQYQQALVDSRHMMTHHPGGMLSIGKLGQGQADYYLQAVAQGIEDYYTGAGEAPGWWTGSAADELDVSGQVDGELLHRALSGQHPHTGDELARPPRGAIRVPGFDLTFSAPKSVSVLFGLGNADLSRQVRDAHEAAVTAALGYMERQAAVARRGRGGTDSVLGNGFLAAAFRHRTSRAGDPQLHTHVLVANMTRGLDGRWTALDARRLYANAKTGGYLYQAQLRAELTRRLGVEWTPVRRGQAEIAGVPTPVLRAFSRRRAEIEQQLDERGERSGRAAQVAALDTRHAKQYGVDAGTLAAAWREQAGQLGLEPETLQELVGREAARPLDSGAVAEVNAELAGPDGLTRQRSSFTRRDVVQAWCDRLGQGADVEVVEALADAFLAGEDVVALARDVRALAASDVVRRPDGRVVPATVEERRHSTVELLTLEHRLLEHALTGTDAGLAQVPAGAADAALARRPTLSDEQARMVRRLVGDGATVQVVVGKAGTGKTVGLDAAREAWQAAGYEVFGVALARRAARELQDGAGIQSTSVAALLADVREHGPTAVLGHGRGVLVVDEAGMVGTRQLAALLDAAQTAHAKVVLVGDDRQLPEIDAGGAFRALAQRTDRIELRDNRRQQQAWEREALDLLRTGRAAEALDRYHQHGRVVVDDNAHDIRDQLVGDWWQARHEHPDEEAVMIAARRRDVAELNGRARALMAADGRLGPDTLEVAGRAFAVGDEVVCLKNARRLGVLNGTRATITALDPRAGAAWLTTRDGETVHLPATYLHDESERGGPTLDHGYAITGHKAQGMTTGRAFVLGTEDLYREWGYVALSRGRTENRLYVVAPEVPDRDEFAPATQRPAALDAFAARLADSRAQTLALDTTLHDEVRELPTPVLQRERDRLHSALTATPDQQRSNREREATGRQRAAAQEARAAARAHRQTLEHDTEHPSDPARLAQARAIEAHAVDRVHSLERREAVVPPSPDPTAPSAATPVRLAAVELELDQRRETARRRALAQPPAYLIATLGPPPERLTERRAWHQLARRIEDFRHDHNIRDPNHALGAQPDDLRARTAWRQLRRDLDRAHARSVEREHDRDTGRTLG